MNPEHADEQRDIGREEQYQHVIDIEFARASHRTGIQPTDTNLADFEAELSREWRMK